MCLDLQHIYFPHLLKSVHYEMVNYSTVKEKHTNLGRVGS